MCKWTSIPLRSPQYPKALQSPRHMSGLHGTDHALTRLVSWVVACQKQGSQLGLRAIAHRDVAAARCRHRCKSRPEIPESRCPESPLFHYLVFTRLPIARGAHEALIRPARFLDVHRQLSPPAPPSPYTRRQGCSGPQCCAAANCGAKPAVNAHAPHAQRRAPFAARLAASRNVELRASIRCHAR